jgi:hypothetical protein
MQIVLAGVLRIHDAAVWAIGSISPSRWCMITKIPGFLTAFIPLLPLFFDMLKKQNLPKMVFKNRKIDILLQSNARPVSVSGLFAPQVRNIDLRF